jgi:hypothetical protein
MDIASNKLIDLIATKYTEFKITDTQDTDKDFCSKSLIELKARKHQLFCGKYITDPNVKGILVYHGLGTGKTLTFTIAANNLNMDTVILAPASLKENEFRTIEKNYTGSKQFYFLSYNSPNFVGQYKKLGVRTLGEEKNANYFDDKFVVIDEAHIFFQNVISGKAQQAFKIFEYLLAAKNIKLMFLTGTPISGDPFELSPMFNLLRKDTFPVRRDEFYNYFVSGEDSVIKNKNVFADRINGLVSYYKGIHDTNQWILPKMDSLEIIRCPMGTVQWSNYIAIRLKEADFERKSRYDKRSFKAGNYKRPERSNFGAYKAGSLQACDFAFPPEVEKKYENVHGTIKNIAETKWSYLLNLFKFSNIYADIEKYSTKIKKLLEHIDSTTDKKIFIYTRFKVVGTYILSEMLKQMGYNEWSPKKNMMKETVTVTNGKTFGVVNGDTENKYDIINYFNDKSNIYGSKMRIIIGTSVMAAGVSLFDTREVHVLEPQWKYSIMDQIVGRINRVCSHVNLPISERTFKVYFYISEVPVMYKELVDFDDGLSSDEIIYTISDKRNKLITSFLHVVKSCAVDCELNLLDNDEVNCRKCGGPQKNILLPSIKEHILKGSQCITETDEIDLFDWKYKEKMYKRDVDQNVYAFNDKENAYEQVGKIENDTLILI